MPLSPHVTPRPAPARLLSVRWLSPPRPGLAGLAAARKEVVASGRTEGCFLTGAAAAAGLAAAAARGAGLAEAEAEAEAAAAAAAAAAGEAQVAGVAGEVADPGVVGSTPWGAREPPAPLLWR